jgi:hypothetical protein
MQDGWSSAELALSRLFYGLRRLHYKLNTGSAPRSGALLHDFDEAKNTGYRKIPWSRTRIS